MRLSQAETKAAYRVLDQANECRLQIFDHADIYSQGQCEEIFGRWLQSRKIQREDLIINSKCGIHPPGSPRQHSPKHYESTARHILKSAENSLRRLNCDYIDCYMIHRPDYLMVGSDVAEAFASLIERQWVRSLGLSNFAPQQVDFIRHYWDKPICLNQIEINITHIDAIFDGTLDQCTMMGIQPQAWSPLAGLFGPTEKIANPHRLDILAVLEKQAQDYGIEPANVMLRWLMFHPANIAPVLGTISPEHLKIAAEQTNSAEYSREHWYQLLSAIQGKPLA